MSYDCAKVFRGWCRSFTKTERWLTLLEAIFLVLFIAFLTYLILHLLACDCSSMENNIREKTKTHNLMESQKDSNTAMKPYEKNTSNGNTCSWTPSFKTEAVTHYYLNEREKLPTRTFKKIASKTTDLNLYDTPDEVDVGTISSGSILALVRTEPLEFGCILSIISARWTVTSASCIDTIEILNHRERFVIMEGQMNVGNGHNVAEVKMHPKYRSNSTHYDLCALKSNSSFRNESVLTLPTPLDVFLTVIGERMAAFGYRRNRSAGVMRAAPIRVLPSQRCAHGTVCAGQRGGACGAGSPLLRGRTLLAVRAGRGAGDCAPATYHSLAPHTEWLRSLTSQ